VNQPIVNPIPSPAEPSAPAAPAPETIIVTPPVDEQRFTVADLERVRQQEKEKLYGRLSKADERTAAVEVELKRLQDEAAGREAAAEAEKVREAQAAEEQEKARREAEMTARELLEARSKEWESRFANLERERETERATLAKEAEFAHLAAYVQERLAQERDAKSIAPELADLVTGNSREEVDASIELMKTKTNAIFESIQQAQVAQRAQMRGTAPTGFTAQGPLDNESGSRQLTPDQIKNMPMHEYRKYRAQLLGAAGEAGSRGLFD
jgi:hypothetical protein